MSTPTVKRGAYSKHYDGKISHDGNVFGLSLYHPDKVPHWQRFGDGHAVIDMQGCAGPGWLQIDTHEFAEKSSKRTMVTLSKADVERLRDLCNLVLGVQP